MKIMKKADIVIIVILLIISFVPYVIISRYQKNYEGETFAVISINGEEKERFELKGHKDMEVIFESDYGFNKVVVRDGKIAIVESNCRDEICKSVGFTDKIGERIVCLPNKLVIEIVGHSNDDSEADIISR
ncbi:MAG: NusG domain II-containing protein [Clostridium sp.]|uniref:NusG domain II-containing protein n=1 Tax=Clostridium sp. TaxID=1506 RepID=UPI003070ED0E